MLYLFLTGIILQLTMLFLLPVMMIQMATLGTLSMFALEMDAFQLKVPQRLHHQVLPRMHHVIVMK